MNIEIMPLGPLGTNCYIVWEKQHAVIMDPGGDSDTIITFCKERAIEPQAILLTHAHFDHIGAVDSLRNHYSIEVYLHREETEWLEDPKLNGSLLFTGEGIKTRKPEHVLQPGYLTIGDMSFYVLHTPGHSPGSVSFVNNEEKIIFGGDVLFQQGVGRTDLPGGDSNQLIRSIRDQLYPLDDSYTVYPGHGPATTIGAEKRLNPFVTA